MKRKETIKKRKLRKLEHKRQIKELSPEEQQRLQQEISNIPAIQEQLSNRINPTFSIPMQTNQGTLVLLAAIASPNATSALTGLPTTAPVNAVTSQHPFQTIGTSQHAQCSFSYGYPVDNATFLNNNPAIYTHLQKEEKKITDNLIRFTEDLVTLLSSKNNGKYQTQSFTALKAIADDSVDPENPNHKKENPNYYVDAQREFKRLIKWTNHLTPEEANTLEKDLRNLITNEFSKPGYFYQHFDEKTNTDHQCIARIKTHSYRISIEHIISLAKNLVTNRAGITSTIPSTDVTSTIASTINFTELAFSPSISISLSNRTENEAVPSLLPAQNEKKKTSTSVAGIVVGVVGGAAALIAAGIGFFRCVRNKQLSGSYKIEKDNRNIKTLESDLERHEMLDRNNLEENQPTPESARRLLNC